MVGDAPVFPGFLTPVLTQLFFTKPPATFSSHASAEVRVENQLTQERKFASTGYRNHNHKVMSPTRSPLSNPGGAGWYSKWIFMDLNSGYDSLNGIMSQGDALCPLSRGHDTKEF